MASNDEKSSLGLDDSNDNIASEKSPLLGSSAEHHDDVEESAANKGDNSATTRDHTRQARRRQKSITESVREILVNRPKPNPCLFLFYFISLVAIVDSLCLLATQVIPIIVAYPKNVDFLFVALRCYVAGFCVVFILVEMRLPLPFLQNNNAFQNFISRGFLYSFNGLIGLEQAYNARIEDVVKHASSKYHIGWTPLFMQISSWTMCVIGYVYIVMGLLCMKQLRDRLEAEYQERLDEYNRADTRQRPHEMK